MKNFEFAVGHKPTGQLAAQDETLFRAFQSNLLSLISHELRTPLMGILNSLSLLDESDDPAIPKEELIKMAKQNAHRLHRSLAALLDLAQLESGVFHARLREIDFSKTVRNRVDAVSKELSEQNLKTYVTEAANAPVLADPQKLNRAVDLCLQEVVPRAQNGSTLEIAIQGAELKLSFEIKPEVKEAWEQAWTQAQAGFQGGVASPLSAFGGVLQSEQAFLTRQEEGLGSEFLLIHEIMRLHRGDFTLTQEGPKTVLTLSFTQVTSEEDVRAILTSRAYGVSTELATVALVLIEVPKKKKVDEFTDRLKEHLFRSSDAVYPLQKRHQVALVVDDCKAEDIPRLIERLEKGLSAELHAARVGWAQCPSDGLDPGQLFDLAESRIREL